MEIGVFPEPGTFQDQSEEFCAALPAFIDRWKQRSYVRIWEDVHSFVSQIIKAFIR
jgi:hypothetical protein